MALDRMYVGRLVVSYRIAASSAPHERPPSNTGTTGPKLSSPNPCPPGLRPLRRTSDGGGRPNIRRRQTSPAPASRGTCSKCCGGYPNKMQGRAGGRTQNTGVNCLAQLASRIGRYRLLAGRPPAWRAILEMPAATMAIGTLARSCSGGRSRGPHAQITSSKVQRSPSANARAFASAGPPVMIRPVPAGSNSTAILAKRFSLVPPYNSFEQRRFFR
jgi:hypothetical protein